MAATSKRSFDFENSEGRFHIESPDGERVTLFGKLPAVPDDGKVTFAAPAPADRRASFSGSGLPFANHEQAFFATPNTGVVDVEADGSFSIELELPGSYYAGLGTVLVPPTVFLTFVSKGKRTVTHVPVGEPIAYRFGTYPMQFVKARDSPLFYKAEQATLPRTQEEIIRASAYPADRVMPRDFWGAKPPV